ncbi:MAG: DNA primase [Firmicutes bacterium]|nr:DNA primase [Bacillota bacterium]
MTNNWNDFVEQVKLANNIVGVTSRYIQLKAKGRNHWGLCPFHHEKTPSFAINETGQYYKCFGCHQSGNVISLVKQLESTDFMGAIEFLAKWANLEMPKVTSDPEYSKKKEKKERVLEILEHARKFYCDNLYKSDERAKGVLKYLHDRGINDELIKTFNIGLSNDWDAMVNLLKKKGYSEQDLIDAGVAAKSEKGRVYDAMAERITFAIFDIYNSCIGFTGRTLSKEKDVAKYRNTAQTIVFDKSNLVYGVDVLKKNKLTNFVENLIVVEGNVDVITLVGAGFLNTVACMGTAVTQFHARIFKRFSSNVYMCFDGDESGKKATLRGVDILANEGLNVRVVSLPKDTDPDDFIQKNGKEAFLELLHDAKPLIDYKLDFIRESSNLKDNLGKAEYLKRAVEVLKPLKNTPELELYTPKVAQTAGVSTDTIERSINDGIAKKKDSPKPEAQVPRTPSGDKYTKAENYVLHLLVSGDKILDIDLVLEFEFGNNFYNRLVKRIHDYKKSGKEFKVGYILDDLDDEERALIDVLLAGQEMLGETEKLKHMQGCIETLNEAKYLKQRDELMRQWNETQDAKILVQINELKKRKV